MSKFTHIVDMLRSSNDQLARMHLFGIMKKVRAGTYNINGDLVTVPELAALLDWLRQRVRYPIAPFDAEAPEKTWLLHALTPGVVAFWLAMVGPANALARRLRHAAQLVSSPNRSRG